MWSKQRGRKRDTRQACQVVWSKHRERERGRARLRLRNRLFVASRPHLHFPYSLGLCITLSSFLLVTSLILQIVLDQFSLSSGRVQLATKNAATFFVIPSINVKSLPLNTNWKTYWAIYRDILCGVFGLYYAWKWIKIKIKSNPSQMEPIFCSILGL